MRIAIVSDAWAPQVNGVVRTLCATVDALRQRGATVETVTPDQFATLPCPSYPEIRLAVAPGRGVARRLEAFAPHAVHIATEGPLGWSARRWCRRRAMPFTTSFHTRFPDYVAMRTRLPEAWFWPPVRSFHRAATRTFAATERLADELTSRGITRTHIWSRGVDLSLFSQDAAPDPMIAALPRPIQLYVGRVSVEKNVEAFLSSAVPGTKVVVGDGPARDLLAARYPDAHFIGVLHGARLAAAYRAADVVVFPSLTDTFGLVMIEALASGVPGGGVPVRGPLDVLGADGRGRCGASVGALDQRIDLAIEQALSARPMDCLREAAGYSWAACTDQFLAGLEPHDDRLEGFIRSVPGTASRQLAAG